MEGIAEVKGLRDGSTLGWGRRDETWQFMRTLGELGGPTWFRLGDADLALHLTRTQALAQGQRLSAVTADLARRLGVGPQVLPMSDGGVVQLESGWPYQTVQALMRKGHHVEFADGPYGGYQAIMRNPAGGWIGASESRKDGQAAGY